VTKLLPKQTRKAHLKTLWKVLEHATPSLKSCIH